MMPHIAITDAVAAACQQMQVGLVRAHVVNGPTTNELWALIEQHCADIAARYELPDIAQRPAIAATRRVYRALGKDPVRYRVASEQLCRRVLSGKGLYRLTTLIDTVNLVSLVSGYPISGLDADRLAGDTLTMGVGRAGELYCGIGRGPLNIEGLPVYRDDLGPVATPTSDEERTKFTPDTANVQICINAFGPEMDLNEATAWMAQLLADHAHATNIETDIVQPTISTDYTL